MKKTPRKIQLFGDVDSQMAGKVVGKLSNCSYLDVFMYSEGGDLGAAFAIYDEIKHVPNSSCTVTGVCFSAATVILQAFKTRRATSNTQFICHLGRYEDPEFEREFSAHMNIRMSRLMASRMGETNFWAAMRLGIFDAQGAEKLGLIDGLSLREG